MQTKFPRSCRRGPIFVPDSYNDTDDESLSSVYEPNTDEASLLLATTNQKHYPELDSDASSVWNFCARFSDVACVAGAKRGGGGVREKREKGRERLL